MTKKELLIFLCLVLFVGTTCIFFGGSYSIDSWNHYGQVVSGDYTDWHSPLMPFVWRVLIKLTGIFSSIYVFQMALYWLLFYLLLKEIKNRYAFLVTVFLGIFFLFIPQYVMKDTHVALPWGLAFALLAVSNEGNRKTLPWLVLPLIVYGLWMRLNTLFAIVPAIYLFTEIYLLREDGIMKKLAVTAGISVVLAGGYFIFTYGILGARHEYPEYKLMLQDVTGISIKSGEECMPACIGSSPDYRKDTIRRLYNPASFDDIYWPLTGRNVPEPTKELAECLSKSWRLAILHHPWIYLGNRMEGFLYYLRIKKRFGPGDYWNVTYYVREPNVMNLAVEHDKTANYLSSKWGGLYTTFFYDPWFWLLLNIGFFTSFLLRYLKRKCYTDKVLAFTQLSAVLFMLSQFPVYQHDRDFRYNYWNVIACIIGFAFYFGRAIGKQAEEETT